MNFSSSRMWLFRSTDELVGGMARSDRSGFEYLPESAAKVRNRVVEIEPCVVLCDLNRWRGRAIDHGGLRVWIDGHNQPNAARQVLFDFLAHVARSIFRGQDFHGEIRGPFQKPFGSGDGMRC